LFDSQTMVYNVERVVRSRRTIGRRCRLHAGAFLF
jgi:hypothetical protein